jgi:hypothetical protein
MVLIPKQPYGSLHPSVSRMQEGEEKRGGGEQTSLWESGTSMASVEGVEEQ